MLQLQLCVLVRALVRTGCRRRWAAACSCAARRCCAPTAPPASRFAPRPRRASHSARVAHALYCTVLHCTQDTFTFTSVLFAGVRTVLLMGADCFVNVRNCSSRSVGSLCCAAGSSSTTRPSGSFPLSDVPPEHSHKRVDWH